MKSSKKIVLLTLICSIISSPLFSRGFHGGGGRGGGFRGGARGFRGGGARGFHGAGRGGRAGTRAGRGWRGGWHGRGYGYGYGRGWGWGWGAAYGFALWPTAALITALYAGNYPYWGYGLGYGEDLVPLAQAGQWDDIQERLETKLDELNSQLAASQSLTQQQISDIKLQIQRIQAHLDGIAGYGKITPATGGK